jgi:hypothetical protein
MYVGSYAFKVWSLLYMLPALTLRTLHVVLNVFLCVARDSRYNCRLLLYTALSPLSLWWRRSVFPVR